MTMLSTWSLRFGAAVLGCALSFAAPAFAGDGCCGEAKEEEKVVAATTPQARADQSDKIAALYAARV